MKTAGDGRMWREDHLRQSGHRSRQQVERQVSPWPYSVLHIIPENEKDPHIAQHVKPASM
jgi:hypothetical protein